MSDQSYYPGGIGAMGTVRPGAAVPGPPPASTTGGRSDPRVGRSPGVARGGPTLVINEGDHVVDPDDAGIEPAGIAAATTSRRADCPWCRYGKPAAAGAALGALVAAAAGREWSQGALWGGLAGLGYGQFFKGG